MKSNTSLYPSAPLKYSGVLRSFEPPFDSDHNGANNDSNQVSYEG
ncbi:hypothetical protein ES332_D05G140700v1 [Gossypium tomentosum]|uniref:Uncharacterized protein n=1 Tax=Gossypium tomentosum TaxID=34277 RepID=A0A5D2KVG7_GOSTO|nr:hypothetical protein ES332_D05G140700v1 [Gossypium tomentosum]